MGTELGIAETGKEGGRGLRICIFTRICLFVRICVFTATSSVRSTSAERLRNRKRKWHHHCFTSAGNFLFFQVLQEWFFPEVIGRRQFYPFPHITLHKTRQISLFQAVPAFLSGGRMRTEQQHLQKQPNLEGEELGSGWDLFPTITWLLFILLLGNEVTFHFQTTCFAWYLQPN